MEQYSSAEDQHLAQNLWAITSEIHRGALRAAPPSVELLCSFHRRLFDGVRDHAGRMRQKGVGSEYLMFGPNKSVINRDVPDQLFDVFRELARAIASLDANRQDPNYEASAVHIAIWCHAEIVRIHPFEDGNGRSSRLIMNWVLIRAGLRPIAMEVVKEEYRLCLNHYYLAKDIQPLVDLAIRLYPLQS